MRHDAMTDRAWGLVCVALAAACRPRQPEPARARVTDRSQTLAASPVDAPPTRDLRWTVSAREAQAHGLAAVGFSLEEAPRSLIATRFPAQGTLALFSGPPGGPLGAIVEADALSGSDALSLRDALRTAPSVRIGSPREAAEPEQVTLGGVMRPAVPLLVGTGPSRTLYCVVMVLAPEGASQGMLVWLYISGLGVTTPGCARVMAHPSLGPFVRGFRVETP